MRTFPALLACLLFAMMLGPPAASAQPDVGRTLVTTFIVRGAALSALRRTLDAVMAAEHGSSVDEFRLSMITIGDTGSVDVRRYPRRPANVIPMGGVRHYHAAIEDNVVQAPQLVSGPAEPALNPDGSPALIEGPASSVSLSASALVEIERALDAVHAQRGASIQMADVLVSYTRVANENETGARSTYGLIVFVTPSDPNRDYTVLMRNGVVDRTYEGIAEPADWLNSDYWLSQR